MRLCTFYLNCSFSTIKACFMHTYTLSHSLITFSFACVYTCTCTILVLILCSMEVNEEAVCKDVNKANHIVIIFTVQNCQ